MTGFDITPMTREIACEGRLLRLNNQKSRDWTHPYEYQSNGSDLHDAGCGVFALCHALEWMNGLRLNPVEVADESVRVGGRGDDGTDRPAMLAGMMKSGFAARCGFRYDGEGLLNDHEKLWAHMLGGGTALCNLRVGHIVALLRPDIKRGRRALLVIDSVAESAHEKFRDRVLDVVEGSDIVYPIRNGQDLVVGYGRSCAMFWVDAELPRDFTLIRKAR